MGIFDSIMGDMSSLSDFLGGAAGGASGKTQDTTSQENRLLRLRESLDYGQQRLTANPTPGQYGVTKSQAPVSVDPADEQSRWINRLNQYLNIVPTPTKGGKSAS